MLAIANFSRCIMVRFRQISLARALSVPQYLKLRHRNQTERCGSLLMRTATLGDSPEHSAEPEGMIRPVALWSGRGRYLLNPLAQPEHDAGQFPLRRCRRGFWRELLFQALLQAFGIGPLGSGCGGVQEHCPESP